MFHNRPLPSDHILRTWIALLLLVTGGSLRLFAAEPVPAPSATAAAELLPKTCVAFAEMADLRSLTDLVFDHPLREEIESLPAMQQALSSKQGTQFKAGLRLFEAGMGKRWPSVLSSLTAGGVYLAFDADTQGLALLVKAEDREILKQIRETVFPAIRGGKLPGSPDDPIQTGEYRGITAYGIGDELKLAELGSWLLVTNKAELGKKVLDLHLAMQQVELDPAAFDSLADSSSFRKAQQFGSPGASDLARQIWGYLDVATLRESGAAADLYSGRTDNPLAELLIGGIVANLKRTELATFQLQADEEGIVLSLRTPHETEWGVEQRSYFFGPDGQAHAPPMLTVPDGLFSMSAYRNISEMWLRSDDLLTDDAVEGLAQADTQLTTLFSGNDFGQDILGALEPDVQFIATRQDFDGVLPRPAIRLPAFALNVQMKDPEATTPEFRRVFQSFIGFLNVVGAMNGQPQLNLFEQKNETTWRVGATYVPERGEEQATDAAINYNFSPTLEFVGRHLILSSSRSLAEKLSTELSPAQPDAGSKVASTTEAQSEQVADSEAAGQPNTIATLDAHILAQILEENEEQLIAQNMLEKGHDRQAAENEIGLLLTLLNMFERGQLELTADQQTLELRVAIQVRSQ